ncbi:S1C family serine protease [Haloferula chungangensis]|uniref:S1C family serine protease n=1 Tax=Haloferula chungangensis TaxID=1048331 RepID=A0ABW2L644_9BACT
MKTSFRQILLLGAMACPLQAIEPPVEAQPIPPRNVPAERKAAGPKVRVELAVPELEAPKAVPVPVEDLDRPYIGVILDPVPDILSSHLKLAAGEGLVVSDLVAGGPAEKSGLKVNDIITRVNGVVVGSSDQVRVEVEKHAVGDRVKLEVVHGGERKELSVNLGAAPDLPQAGMAFGGADDLENLLGKLPEKHADLMRQAMEQGMNGLGQLNEGAGIQDDWQRDILKKMEKMRAGGGGIDFDHLKAESSVRLLDDQGSVEVKSVEGSKEVRVFDKAGKLVWEGPYDTEQDKAAVPDDIRERIDKVNINMDFAGDGIRLQMGPQRFRPLEDVEPPRPNE